MAGKYSAAGSSRNFGYGRDLAYAGREALIDYYGDGHFATVATHASRFGQFSEWAREQGIRDLARNDPERLLRDFSEYVGQQVSSKNLAVAYGQNLISSAQVVLRAMTGDSGIKVSPSDYCGSRSNVRKDRPGSLDRAQAAKAAASMRAAGRDRAASVVELARELGLREREATLADLPRLEREARETGVVNIQEGAKGGRTADRLVPVSQEAYKALRTALDTSPEGSRNLLAAGESYRKFVDGELREGRQELKAAGIAGYHDCRAAYACERYTQLTGHEAPVVTGSRIAPRDLDMTARAEISQELGHVRVDVVGNYIGGVK
ncbi:MULTISPECIES: integrase domain-containing protein [unclassified Wenzhouxiangella]|uniref:integrase domain-containing protein n=1 Tax=unclassified Wenzhouxiangella TaxID=2613841 RepID=UPI0015F27FC7|nr:MULTISPECIES: integrase domain-containing protein [unclassified Wenzhouxiangella]